MGDGENVFTFTIAEKALWGEKSEVDAFDKEGNESGDVGLL